MSIFKAYDIRGLSPEQLDATQAYRIGYGFCRFLIDEGEPEPRIVVGRDMRLTSPELTRAFAQGIERAGGTPLDAGLATTPMLYVAVGLSKAVSGGVIVTASHNGPEYNGFKLCRAGALPISGTSGLKDIEALSQEAPDHDVSKEPAFEELSFERSVREDTPALPDPNVSLPLWQVYWSFVADFKREWPADLHLAIDPANGMGCLYTTLLEALGARVTLINGKLDGRFPAHEANPIKAENIKDCCELVQKSGATLGVAFDGDADRVAFADEEGNAIASDLLTALLAKSVLAHEKGASVLYDLRSSRAVAEVIREAGGKPVRERVGHSFMKATMRAEGCVFGGELSGHYYYRDAFFADSSLLSVIALLNALGEWKRPLSELTREVRRYAQSGEMNFEVADKGAILAKLAERYNDAEIDYLDGVTVQYPEWWFNVRPSNTEPLLRLNIEANSQALLDERVRELRALIGEKV